MVTEASVPVPPPLLDFVRIRLSLAGATASDSGVPRAFLLPSLREADRRLPLSDTAGSDSWALGTPTLPLPSPPVADRSCLSLGGTPASGSCASCLLNTRPLRRKAACAGCSPSNCSLLLANLERGTTTESFIGKSVANKVHTVTKALNTPELVQ